MILQYNNIYLHIMFAQGKHFAKFKISTCDPIVIFQYVYCRIGIMRPISSKLKKSAPFLPAWFCPLSTPMFSKFLEEKTPAWGESDVNCCLYYDYSGYCEYSNWASSHKGKKEKKWEGMKGFDIYDGELGLLLDLDEGTLSVYKNGVRLGTMMSGLSGEYTWVAQIIAQANGRPDQQNVRIERAPLPKNLSGYDVTNESSLTEHGAGENLARLMRNL